ncbi:HD domain-containing protein [Desulfurispora thermophila]|uniref:HD domain-containing protein n=1 Tax=Desulfurispora thermophila TaxID=265470 RepID=UPI000360DD5B|nr:HD domain-containing protein [Desulfurispora thermophila]
MATKHFHEFRDPLHVFIKIDSDERKVVDSPPFQRLRYIHQLATSYLVYPGAKHTRFEHSLGVMEVASRIYDVVTHPNHIHPLIKEQLPEISHPDKVSYWRRVLRMAALCHDLGHLPFSHAAEKELLPDGWNHETLTVEFIRSDAMRSIWENLTPPLREKDILKLAVGPKKLPGEEFSIWETILAEIIVGNAFGADRIDYLLRDSYYAGVSYGRFDHFRLIDSLRILPAVLDDQGISREPALGVEEGGIHSAEALLLARYFMYTQVYFHPVRRAYDVHLMDFLRAYLPDGHFPVKAGELQLLNDNHYLARLWDIASDKDRPLYYLAERLVNRKHFKLLYSRNPLDICIYPQACEAIYMALQQEFGSEYVRRDAYTEKGTQLEFPVLRNDGSIVSSYVISDVLGNLPVASFDYIFIAPELLSKAEKWLENRKTVILQQAAEELIKSGED